MFENIGFDEINALIENKRSIPIEQYFSEMELSKEDQEKRINIANDLYDSMLGVMALMFTMAQFNRIDYESVRNAFLDAYTSVLSKYIDIDEELEVYARQLSYDLADASQRHAEDIYYYSPDRAMFIAENEANTAMNHSEYTSAVESGKTIKRWIAVVDDTTRPTHLKINGKAIPINDFFQVGNSLMRYPKDILGDAEEVINCRCTIIYR